MRRFLGHGPGWANVDDGLLRCLNRQLGDVSNNSLELTAVLPPTVLVAAIDEAKRGARGLTALEKAQLILMLDAIRHKFGLSLVSGTISVHTTTTIAPHPNASPSSSSGRSKIKIKLSQVVDQGSDIEIEQLDHSKLLEDFLSPVKVTHPLTRKR